MRFRHSLFVLASAIAAFPVVGAQSPAPSPLSVRITSPIGRTGTSVPVRIVAQVQDAPAATPGQVRFFVDRQLLGAVQRPPYAVEWIDENPFERREIAVEVVDALGHAGATDTVVPRPIRGHGVGRRRECPAGGHCPGHEGPVRQGHEGCAHSLCSRTTSGSRWTSSANEAVGATFTLLVRQQREHVAPHGLRSPHRRHARQLSVAARSNADRAVSRTTSAPSPDRRQTASHHPRGRSRGSARKGGTAILDSLAKLPQILASAEGRQGGHPDHGRVRRAQLDVVCRRAYSGANHRGQRCMWWASEASPGFRSRASGSCGKLAVETGGRFFFPSAG